MVRVENSNAASDSFIDGSKQRKPALFSMDPIPPCAGVGLKQSHIATIIETSANIGWFEIHAENYMGQGGPPHWRLESVRERYPISLHGVGLSIGGPGPLDRDHMLRFLDLERRYRPGLVSEHLAWSSHDDVYYNDLLPLPLNKETCQRTCEHIDEFQQVLGRQMLLENPSNYLSFLTSTFSEIEFLSQIVSRTKCGLLLDVNNVWVSSVNLKFDPNAFIEAFPHEHVSEIHIGGYSEDADETGDALLIDSHGSPVKSNVWKLLRRTIEIGGVKPVLIEWDNEVPEWSELQDEAVRANSVLSSAKIQG